MARMKEVCELTGLSEKAVRLYIREKLITPIIEEGIHRNSFTFTEENIIELRDIRVLRSAGFSIAEIREMKTQPHKIHDLLGEKQRLLSQELFEKGAVLEALERLDFSGEQSGSALAEALAQPVAFLSEEKEKASIRRGLPVKQVVIFAVIALLFALIYVKLGLIGLIPVLIFILILLCAASLGTAIHTVLLRRRMRRLSDRTEGVLIDLVRRTGFSSFMSRAGNDASGMMEAGIGGIWQIVLLLINEMRPDHWYCLIRYEAEGMLRNGLVPFGCLYRASLLDQTVAIAFERGKYEQVLPCDETWYVRRLAAYLCFGALMLFLAVILTKSFPFFCQLAHIGK